MVMHLMKMVLKTGEAFQFGALINQSTNKQYSWNLTFIEFSGTYVSHIKGILQNLPFFAYIIQSVLVTEAGGSIVQIRNLIK